jgi:hypothetical protein
VEHLNKTISAPLALAVNSAYSAQQIAARNAIEAVRLIGVTMDAAQVEKQLASINAAISYTTYRQLALEHDADVARFSSQPNAMRAAPTTTTTTTAATTARPRAQPTVTTMTTMADPNAMDVDQIQQPRGRRCYKCGQVGHIQRNCPNPQPPAIRVLDGLNPEDVRRWLATRNRNTTSPTTAASAAPMPQASIMEVATEKGVEQDFPPPQ